LIQVCYGHLEELSNVFEEGLVRLRETELIMMLYVNTFSALGVNFVAKGTNAIYEANVEKP
jgi:hypothetical protein